MNLVLRIRCICCPGTCMRVGVAWGSVWRVGVWRVAAEEHAGRQSTKGSRALARATAATRGCAKPWRPFRFRREAGLRSVACVVALGEPWRSRACLRRPPGGGSHLALLLVRPERVHVLCDFRVLPRVVCDRVDVPLVRLGVPAWIDARVRQGKGRGTARRVAGRRAC